ncbi:MAG TPA: DUF4082 domain-containing protein [Pseudomonadales bacterium]|nr:DUF4082 domain-containing protein [Pseudomonadales bacterium]
MITSVLKTKGTKTVLGLMVLAATTAAHAQMEAMPGYNVTPNPAYTPVMSSINGPVGWTFQPTTEISVTALGIFNNLPANLEVGLWNASGTLLASSTIKAGAVAIDQSLYESITPVDLTAGQTYYLAAYSPSGAFSALALSPNITPADGNAIMSPDIQLGTAAYANNGVFEFPGVTESVPDSAIIAPNFEYAPVVPEPSTLYLLGAGSLALLIRRRR